MNLLVIFTGGTIGSSVNEGYISATQSKTYKLIEMYKNLGRRKVNFFVKESYTLLSENLTGEYITKLGNYVLENVNENYDGIIITHGTDTIQYSTAILGYLLASINIPVLLVSSNFILDDKRANGFINFTAAIDFISSKAGKGIFVSYLNNNGVIYIHRGTRLLPHNPYSDNLQSVLNQYYGIVTDDGNFIKNNNYQVIEELILPKETNLELPNSWNSDILRIFPYPGMSYPNLEKPPKAILLDTYHSGTICSITPNMEHFFKNASKNNIPVFLTGANKGFDYESTKYWKSLGIIILPQASPIAMYSKLWLALSSKKLLQKISLEKFMVSSLGEDIIED